MTTVYVVTAGSGDTYRIDRIYLDSEEAFWDAVTEARADLAGTQRKQSPSFSA